MAIRFKVSFNFKYVSGDGSPSSLALAGGWSEGFYTTVFDPDVFDDIKSLAQLRAVMLPTAAYIKSIRIQQVNPVGPSTLRQIRYPGGALSSLTASDIPQLALLIQFKTATARNVRPYRLCCLPDDAAKFGEFVANTQMRNALTAWMARFSSGPFYFVGADLDNPLTSIATIDATGVLVLNAGFVPALGSKVKILRTMTVTENFSGGIFTVNRNINIGSFGVSGWRLGACVGGNVQQFTQSVMPIRVDINDVDRVVTRKIGRPPVGYRGRRSNRR